MTPARRGGVPGPLVAPGTYIVRLVAGGRTLEQKVEVREDPRIDVTPAERKQWTDAVHAGRGARPRVRAGQRSDSEDAGHRR